MGDRFLMRLDEKRRKRWEAAAKALFLPLTTFIKAATDEKAEKVLGKENEPDGKEAQDTPELNPPGLT